jgi:pimeloyl-ACP methyl ester carboxylesterase
VKYDKVGVIKVGPAKAKNVLVLAPGTSAGSAYFVPLAQWLVSKLPGWQVWSEERRENLLEDQSVLNLAKGGKASAKTVFNYYLGYLTDPSVAHHFKLLPDSSVQFAKRWGMNVAVQDMHRVIAAARKLGGKVVLGGHSLGGSVVTAYATWNFSGDAGADDLAGLVYIDGGSLPSESASDATASLTQLSKQATPWLSFGGIAAPFAGLFNATGSLGALQDPNARSLGQQFPALPADLKPPVPVTNLGQYGYALNVGTSPASLIAAQGHLGKGVTKTAKNGLHGWDDAGALTPIKRFATMFSGIAINNVDGTEWYFHSTMGRRLPRTLKIYAFGAALGGQGVLLDAQQLAKQSHIPKRNLILINRHSTYAHNDPAGAFPRNVFFDHLVPFLSKISRG